MTGKPAVAWPAQRAGADRAAEYDILILDASLKQSLACARSLGRAGLRIAMAEAASQHRRRPPLPAFESSFCSRAVVLPDYATDPEEYADAVVRFAGEHRVRVVLPAGDATCMTLLPRREELAALGATLALPPTDAMELALHKDRTLEIARQLGIAYPLSMPIRSLDDLSAAATEFGYPVVIKPTSSWTGKSAERIVPAEVVNHEEAKAQAQFLFSRGADVIAQQWASGRREGVTLFMQDGGVLAACGHVEHRTTPLLGGVSVVRESITAPDDIYTAAVHLAKAMGLDGLCEVEFRRDAGGQPLLMEINPRIPGTLENSIRAGVNFPLLIWQWATGQPVDRVDAHRPGVRTRWLHGDIRWLRENFRQTGRPDGVPRAKAVLTFAAEFFLTRHYDYVDLRDLRPALAEMRYTASVLRKPRPGA